MAGSPQRFSPVFLVAAPQSGAATLRHMLTHHPDIAFAPGFDFLGDAISPDGRFLKRDAFLRTIEYNMAYKRLGLSIPPAMSFVGIAHSLLDQVAATRPGAAVVGVTLHRHFERMLWLWPDARFIHLVRDGRDVAYANVLEHKAGNLWHGIADWVETEILWDRMSHKLPPERQFTVKYEVLAGEPEYELRRLCDYLELPFAPAMLEQAGRPAREDIGRWRKSDVRELSSAEHRAARWLLQNGYFLSGTVRAPSILRRAGLSLSNKLATANHQRRILGTGSWVKGSYVARFGSRKAKARLKRRRAELLSRDQD